jgi:hypothetical protein
VQVLRSLKQTRQSSVRFVAGHSRRFCVNESAPLQNHCRNQNAASRSRHGLEVRIGLAETRDLPGRENTEWRYGDSPFGSLRRACARKKAASPVAPKNQIVEAVQADLPCPVPPRKNILLFRNPKSPVYPPPSRSLSEGRLAIVTDVGYGMRWTRQRWARKRRRTMLRRTAKSCGPDTPTLVSSCCGSDQQQ